MRSISTLAVLFLALAPPALASDGVLEINQACAVNTGCFPGDAAGYPVTISLAGASFVLTSRLVVPDERMDAILINRSSVSIDLGGFEIIGPVTCSGTPLVCTPASGGGTGVEAATSRGISVKNGSVSGMGRVGVLLGEQAEVTNLRVRGNAVDGIRVDNGSTVSGNTVYQNGKMGIYAGSGSTVSGNTTYENGNIGMAVDAGSTISGNTASQNEGDGILSAGGNTIVGNTAFSNGDATTDDGIECQYSCTVRGNTVRSNSGHGLNLGPDCAYSDNVVSQNTAGAVTGPGSANSRGGNYCSGTGTVSASCP